MNRLSIYWTSLGKNQYVDINNAIISYEKHQNNNKLHVPSLIRECQINAGACRRRFEDFVHLIPPGWRIRATSPYKYHVQKLSRERTMFRDITCMCLYEYTYRHIGGSRKNTLGNEIPTFVITRFT